MLLKTIKQVILCKNVYMNDLRRLVSEIEPFKESITFSKKPRICLCI